MTKLHTALAAFAAVLVLPSVSSVAFADNNPQTVQLSARAPRESAMTTSPTIALDETGGTGRDVPAEGNATRKIDLEVEPIAQSVDSPPADKSAEEQPTTATEQFVPQPDAPSAISDAGSNDEVPVTASRICRKFSAAIAMIIEVPCERRAF